MKTKYFIISALAACAMTMTSCSDEKLPEVAPVASGTVTDGDGNVYSWVQIGDLQWTTSNANCGPSMVDASYIGSWGNEYVFEEDYEEEYIENEFRPKYGNLMQITDALKCVPEGWRIPTDEDWAKLEAAYGVKNPESMGARAAGVAFNMMAANGLALTLGGAILPTKSYGWYEWNLERVGSFGYYWTSTVDTSRDDPDNVYYYYRRINNYNGEIDRESTVESCWFSVRWVRDAK